MWSRWRERPLCLDQVANGPDRLANLAPVSETPAANTRTGWAPVLSGQAIPRLGERAYDYPLPDDC